MGMEALAVLSGIAQGTQQASNNYFNVLMAKRKLDLQEQEKKDEQKKWNMQYKLMSEKLDLQEQKINSEIEENKRKASFLMSIEKGERELQPGESFSYGGRTLRGPALDRGFTPYQQRGIDLGIQEGLKIVQTGQYIDDYGDAVTLDSREKTEQHLYDKKIDARHPQIKQALDRKFGNLETISVPQSNTEDSPESQFEYELDTQKKSPYPEYPDAFLENGVWKVVQNGKKYRIE